MHAAIVIAFLSFVYAQANEWGCSTSFGTFTQTTNCNEMNQVTLTGDLSITGKESTYTTLFAASGKRHFYIDYTSGTPTLTLTWLNMTGGYRSSSNGGSIYWYDVGGHLNITHCVFYKNSVGSSGGVIFANDNNVLISLTNTKFIKNNAGNKGGGIYLRYGTLNSHIMFNIFRIMLVVMVVVVDYV